MTSLLQTGRVGSYVFFLVVDATTFFVFISGYLFHYIEHHRFRYPEYLRKKAKFVILPYLVLSIPAVLAGLYFSKAQLMNLSPGGYVLWSLVVGGSVVGAMWFIPMIAVFFLASPLMHFAARTKFLYLLTPVALGISLFSSRPIGSLNPVLSFVHFFGFYLLGMASAAAHSTISAVQKGWVPYLLIALGIAGFLFAALQYDPAQPEPLGFQDGWGRLNIFQLGKLLLLVSVFFFFERYLNAKNRVLGYLAEVSFGLFFMHGFFVIVFAKIRQYVQFSDAFTAFACESVVVIGGAIATVELVKLVFKKNSRYVIGC
jgi:hypothetical protein